MTSKIKRVLRSFKPELSTDGGKSYGTNATAFATHEEAASAAMDIFHRWMAATDWRVVESDDPVTHTHHDGVLGYVTKEEA